MVVVVVVAVTARARGDAIWVVTSSGREAPIADVRIGDVSGGKIGFEDSSGKRGQRDLAQVARIEMDDEPALAGAETAYEQRQWSAAAEGYQRALAATRRVWLKAWIAPRLVESAENAGNLLAGVEGYLALVRTNPARAETLVPNVVDANPKALDDAANELSEALADRELTAKERQLLLSFLLDVQRARHDQAGADRVLDQMLKSGDVSAARAVVRKKLDAVSELLAKENWPAATSEINSKRQLFVEPRDQAEAFFDLAEAAQGHAETSNDPDVWKDVALAYLRVYADFKDVPGAPFVAASLLKAAGVEEHIGDVDGATKLYQQVASQFQNSPAATSARQQLARLEKTK